MLDNIDEANRIYTQQIIKKDSDFVSFDREFYAHLYKIFVANHLGFDRLSDQNSLFVKSRKLFMDYSYNSSNLLMYLNYMTEVDKSWVESNLTQQISFSDFKNKMLDCYEKYPMISVLGSHYSDWRSEGFSHEETIKRIDDYITMCDLCG